MIFSVEMNRSTSVLGCDSPSGAYKFKTRVIFVLYGLLFSVSKFTVIIPMGVCAVGQLSRSVSEFSNFIGISSKKCEKWPIALAFMGLNNYFDFRYMTSTQ